MLSKDAGHMCVPNSLHFSLKLPVKGALPHKDANAKEKRAWMVICDCQESEALMESLGTWDLKAPLVLREKRE